MLNICFAGVRCFKGQQRMRIYQPIVLRFEFDSFYNSWNKHCCKLSPGHCYTLFNSAGLTFFPLKERVLITKGDSWIEFKISNVQDQDAGYYRCLVTGDPQLYQDYWVTLSGKCNRSWTILVPGTWTDSSFYQQRFQMDAFSASRQSHQLSEPQQQRSHTPPAGFWVKTSLRIAGIHPADITFWSTGVSPFEPPFFQSLLELGPAVHHHCLHNSDASDYFYPMCDFLSLQGQKVRWALFIHFKMKTSFI